MLADFYAHRFFTDPKAADEVEDDTFDLQAELDALAREDDGEWETLSNKP